MCSSAIVLLRGRRIRAAGHHDTTRSDTRGTLRGRAAGGGDVGGGG
ncbi:hypothetical protein FM119_05590 [Mycetocola reblochoni REB411]|uniref:Uncharacterized protein n=1 Tax=Mycetocola reblochoni REB411 TaxID=1255698 RepID=A0A1R4J5R6_9MICO|nr:hypothetical protein FM119_05590 [Mycetocola reblochoni REB411]